MEKNRTPKSNCTGGANCPLGIWQHPKANFNVSQSKYALGCSLCRSDKLSELVLRPTNQDTTGVNLESREEMRNKHGHFKGHDINREMKIYKGKSAPKATPGKQGQ